MGFKIRECRNEINMSQEELSKKSGVSRTIISGLENGTITVTTTETLLRIARAMNKRVVDIFLRHSSTC
ncbi:MAG: helix-turn-helix transcriptional regulator [Blautia wexlerae]